VISQKKHIKFSVDAVGATVFGPDSGPSTLMAERQTTVHYPWGCIKSMAFYEKFSLNIFNLLF